MAHITTCTHCGKAYEETSEETANMPERLCPGCSRLLAYLRVGQCPPSVDTGDFGRIIDCGKGGFCDPPLS